MAMILSGEERTAWGLVDGESESLATVQHK